VTASSSPQKNSCLGAIAKRIMTARKKLAVACKILNTQRKEAKIPLHTTAMAA